MTNHIAFIGVGNMGNPMADQLVKAGKEVKAFDVSPEVIKIAKESGLNVVSTMDELLDGASTVISMLPEGKHVRSLYLGDKGILNKIPKENKTLFSDSLIIEFYKPPGNPEIRYTEKATTKMPKAILEKDSFLIGESCGNLIFPKRYSAKPMKIIIQIPKKTSSFKIPQCFTKSAFDKNLKAKANSKNPKTTFVVFSQPPDFGSELSIFGNIANSAKGKPKANPKPPIPAVNCHAPPSAVNEPASKEPSIGPVHEKDTMASVSAMKKTPKTPPIFSPLLVLFVQLAGKVNS